MSEEKKTNLLHPKSISFRTQNSFFFLILPFSPFCDDGLFCQSFTNRLPTTAKQKKNPRHPSLLEKSNFASENIPARFFCSNGNIFRMVVFVVRR